MRLLSFKLQGYNGIKRIWWTWSSKAVFNLSSQINKLELNWIHWHVIWWSNRILCLCMLWNELSRLIQRIKNYWGIASFINIWILVGTSFELFIIMNLLIYDRACAFSSRFSYIPEKVLFKWLYLSIWNIVRDLKYHRLRWI